MIPLIVWMYTVKQWYIVTMILVAVSAITDVIDGKIARKYNLVSEIGKVLDPVADKLTQFALIVCLSTRYENMVYLAATLFLREMLMLFFGLFATVKKRGMFSSKWYGKLPTVTIYLSVIALLIYPDMPLKIVNVMMIIAETLIIVSMVLYVRLFILTILEPKRKKADGIADEENDE